MSRLSPTTVALSADQRGTTACKLLVIQGLRHYRPYLYRPYLYRPYFYRPYLYRPYLYRPYLYHPYLYRGKWPLCIDHASLTWLLQDLKPSLACGSPAWDTSSISVKGFRSYQT